MDRRGACDVRGMVRGNGRVEDGARVRWKCGDGN